MFLINGTLSTTLPFRLYLPDGRTRTSLHEMSEAQLAELGIYPCEEIKPPLTWTQHYGAPVIEVTDGRATATYPILDYSPDEVAGILEAAKAAKRADIAAAHKEHVAGSVMTSLGFPMQFGIQDSLMVEGAIKLAQASGAETIYLTDANDVSHYDVSLADAQTVLLEMSTAFAQAHAKKQTLRERISKAQTQSDLDDIVW